ncbi:MAG: NAD(P)-dependent oxidoreductase [Chloroflexi bacterium]|nr:NAD(P)-dependent oxidoreductase [Chloroflexota bacterium]MCC6893107.1 NAD(P)-dependent oxidoreductase [Anaerolineae bacterium]
MRIFLAGATGAIGRLLVPLLVQSGWEVYGTTRRAEKAASITAAGGHPIVVDALDRDGLFKALAEVQPKVVLHMMTDLNDRDFAANTNLRIEGTRNLVDAALAAGSVERIIAESIAWMYGAGDAPAQEDEPLDLNAPEARLRGVKAVQALETTASELPVSIIMRFGIFYGPGTWYARDGFTADQMRRGELVANDAVTSFIHVADAAQAVIHALDWPDGNYNITDDEPAAAKDWLPIYANLLDAPPPPLKDGAGNWERGASNAKAKAQGWQPKYRTWRDGFINDLT